MNENKCYVVWQDIPERTRIFEVVLDTYDQWELAKKVNGRYIGEEGDEEVQKFADIFFEEGEAKIEPIFDSEDEFGESGKNIPILTESGCLLIVTGFIL